ncbi:large conductance mechanosensitive channel protein MscL [Phascolarctobacterium sp.]|uniref:large conductance mechanosensitive channel protein MscL n=1 Tax=Phascolarctobacterium sp. TaxID=2049039 RepID=UPI00386CA4F8
MSFKEDFKKFAMRGNVIDMAVGVIVGGAFGKIVGSLVNDVIMPPLGMVVGKMDFTNLFVALNGKEYATLEAAKKAGAPVLAYGSFVNTVLNFLILAFVVFMMIRQINKLTPPPAPKPEPRLCPYCKSEIADDATRCPHCTSILEEVKKA